MSADIACVEAAALNAAKRAAGAECGTPAGYQRHLRSGETTCEACKKAHREYVRERRSERGISASSVRLNRARGRALTRLRALYPETFARLLAEELAEQREAR